MRYLLTIDLNGKIIEKVELNGIDGIYDVLLADNKIMSTVGHKLKKCLCNPFIIQMFL